MKLHQTGSLSRNCHSESTDSTGVCSLRLTIHLSGRCSGRLLSEVKDRCLTAGLNHHSKATSAESAPSWLNNAHCQGCGDHSINGIATRCEQFRTGGATERMVGGYHAFFGTNGWGCGGE
jgi:hypothetical protein